MSAFLVLGPIARLSERVLEHRRSKFAIWTVKWVFFHTFLAWSCQGVRHSDESKLLLNTIVVLLLLKLLIWHFIQLINWGAVIETTSTPGHAQLMLDDDIAWLPDYLFCLGTLELTSEFNCSVVLNLAPGVEQSWRMMFIKQAFIVRGWLTYSFLVTHARVVMIWVIIIGDNFLIGATLHDGVLEGLVLVGHHHCVGDLGHRDSTAIRVLRRAAVGVDR